MGALHEGSFSCEETLYSQRNRRWWLSEGLWCKHRRGTCTKVYAKASGKVIRYVLQQLEEMGLVEQVEEGSGRMITKEGQRELDTVAVQAVAVEDEDDDDEE